jgi:type II secretory pathway component PulJ
MNLNISNPALGTKRKMKTWGMTVPEMMVAVAVGSLVLMVMAMVFTTSARSFVALGNYVSMDCNSRNALDRMTREIRRAGDLIEFSPTHLKFVAYGQTNSFLEYDWDANSRQLTEWKTAPCPRFCWANAMSSHSCHDHSHQTVVSEAKDQGA